ncbi:MAG: signal recognition particle-docking protein FtsY [Gemmatimonadales bacterium]
MATSRIGDSPRLSLWQRVKRVALTDVGALVRGMNAADLEALERTLIEADFGVQATIDVVQMVEDQVRRGQLKTEEELKAAVGARLAKILEMPGLPPGDIARAPGSGPTVIVFVGVNGVGKTTSVAKVARKLQREGRKVLLAAADTYRAGAIAQLQVWAERLGVPCVAGAPGGDPAAVAYDAIEAATTRGCDTVLIDTAGRLHTQDGLMDELRKVIRVITRKLPGAPHETLLVLDGTVGQNAIQQGKQFMQAVQPTGVIVTKLDGSARGGAVVALRSELGLPIRFLGLGETVEDLEPFEAKAFAERLLE